MCWLASSCIFRMSFISNLKFNIEYDKINNYASSHAKFSPELTIREKKLDVSLNEHKLFLLWFAKTFYFNKFMWQSVNWYSSKIDFNHSKNIETLELPKLSNNCISIVLWVYLHLIRISYRKLKLVNEISIIVTNFGDVFY